MSCSPPLSRASAAPRGWLSLGRLIERRYFYRLAASDPQSAVYNVLAAAKKPDACSCEPYERGTSGGRCGLRGCAAADVPSLADRRPRGRRRGVRRRVAADLSESREAPSLSLQGDNDIRVPAARRRKSPTCCRPAQCCQNDVLSRAGHGFAKRETQVDVLRCTVAWFDRCLAPAVIEPLAQG